MPHLFFPTRFGDCGVAWNDSGLTAFELPNENRAQAGQRLAAKAPSEPAGELVPAWVTDLVARVRRHFEGDLQDFSDTTLDRSRLSDFQRDIYRQTQAIKPGYKKSYGEIARQLALGPEAARAVGVALGANPWPLIVPCHRVVSANDKMTGFSGPGGIRTKTRLLALEGAELLSE